MATKVWIPKKADDVALGRVDCFDDEGFQDYGNGNGVEVSRQNKNLDSSSSFLNLAKTRSVKWTNPSGFGLALAVLELNG